MISVADEILLAWGKSFCMLYAVIGIPLCLVMFQSVGERLNNFASWCIKTIKKCVKLRHYESTQTELVIVGTVLAVGVVTGGAAMFHHYETWDYFDCVYYCFITLTTIGSYCLFVGKTVFCSVSLFLFYAGFGDFVALQTKEALNTNVFYVVLSMTFILFGLTVVASSMNLLVLRFLTMNTEDERREEIQSAVARNSLRFDSELISPNGNIRLSLRGLVLHCSVFLSLSSRHAHSVCYTRTVRISLDWIDTVWVRTLPLFFMFQAKEERTKEVHRTPHARQDLPSRAHATFRLDYGSTHIINDQTVQYWLLLVCISESPTAHQHTGSTRGQIIDEWLESRWSTTVLLLFFVSSYSHLHIDQFAEAIGERSSQRSGESSLSSETPDDALSFPTRSRVDSNSTRYQTIFRVISLFVDENTMNLMEF